MTASGSESHTAVTTSPTSSFDDHFHPFFTSLITLALAYRKAVSLKFDNKLITRKIQHDLYNFVSAHPWSSLPSRVKEYEESVANFRKHFRRFLHRIRERF